MIQLSFPILIPLSNQLGISGVVMMHFLPHSSLSWILSYAGNPASSSLQDGATEWQDNVENPNSDFDAVKSKFGLLLE